MKKSIHLAVAFLSFVLIIIILIFSGCNNRVNLYDVYQEQNAPDVNLKIGIDYNVPDGTGYCDFGTVMVETTKEAVFIIENTGGSALSITGISLIGGDIDQFSVDLTSMESVVNANTSTVFTISFSPTREGNIAAKVKLESDDPDENPYIFTLKGYGSPIPVPDMYILKGASGIPNGFPGHDFGTVLIGESDGPIVFTIENSGTANLIIDSISIGSGAALDYMIDDSSMTYTISPGESTEFSIIFSPTDSGQRSAAVQIENNDSDDDPYTFTLEGIGEPKVPDIYIKKGNVEIANGSIGHNFGTIMVNQSSTPVTITIGNRGTEVLNIPDISSSDPFQFSLDETGRLFSLPPGDTQVTTFTLTFNPEAPPDSKSANVTISSDDPDTGLFSFTVTGFASPTPVSDITVKKGPTEILQGTLGHDFDPVEIGASSTPVTFTIENSGDADLIVTGISSSSTEFTINNAPTFDVIISPDGTETFSIIFSPSGIGITTATISINSNDPDSDPFTFTVEGEAAIPDIHVQQGATNIPDGSTFSFGSVLLGSSSNVQFSVQNSGTGVLTVDSIYTSSTDFTLYSSPSMPFTVAPGSNQNFTIEFAPSTSGNITATITIESDDPDSFENPYNFTVTGYGETPVPEINVKQDLTNLPNGSGIYIFGHVQEGDSSIQTFTIENNGTAPLIISGILKTEGDTDQFIIDYSIPPIAPGDSDIFTITFAPTYSGDKWATITIVNNDPDDDLYTFRVEGMVGLPPVVDIEVWEGATYYPDGSIYNGFGTVSVGSSSPNVIFTIWNNGPDDLLIPSIVITGGNVADFDLDLNSTNLNTYIPAGWNTTFSVTFTPQSSGNKWLDLDINYNDPLVTPYKLRFEGEGED